ncbi:unnamed protein product [Auanema sp. JU1783]|nr:unnamed protein product [Auanema sp. JU1783]
MSAGIAVKRPQTEKLRLYNQISTEKLPEKAKDDIIRKPIASTTTTSATSSSPTTNSCEKETASSDNLEDRLRAALRERDEQWRKHEKAQITFLQQESSNMLKGLHSEIERLGHQLRDAKHKLLVTGTESVSICDHTELEKTISQQEEAIRMLEEKIIGKEDQVQNIEKTVTATILKLQEQIHLQGERIRQLTSEMNDRNQTVAHLSSQLRAYRLRDAMATAQQRRRASHGGNSPSPASDLVSPTTPFRVFPPSKGLVSASVTVSYPGSRSDVQSDSSEAPCSIERPRRRRSTGIGFGK